MNIDFIGLLCCFSLTHFTSAMREIHLMDLSMEMRKEKDEDMKSFLLNLDSLIFMFVSRNKISFFIFIVFAEVEQLL